MDFSKSDTTVHYYYGDPKTLDLTKMREEAEIRARGSEVYHNEPATSIIHFHTADATCTRRTSEGSTLWEGHEVYTPQADAEE